MYGAGGGYGNAGLLAATVALVCLVVLATCGPANAAPVDLRFRHPGGDPRAYDALEVCTSAGCTRYARACAPGATCELEAQLPPGRVEAWLVGRSGALSSAASNRRVFDVPAPVGCEWDLNADGVVAFGPSDFGPFLSGFTGGRFTAADFGRFMRAAGTDCR